MTAYLSIPGQCSPPLVKWWSSAVTIQLSFPEHLDFKANKLSAELAHVKNFPRGVGQVEGESRPQYADRTWIFHPWPHVSSVVSPLHNTNFRFSGMQVYLTAKYLLTPGQCFTPGGCKMLCLAGISQYSLSSHSFRTIGVVEGSLRQLVTGSPSSEGHISDERRPQKASCIAMLEPGDTHSRDLFWPAQTMTDFSEEKRCPINQLLIPQFKVVGNIQIGSLQNKVNGTSQSSFTCAAVK